jgi:thiol-disulfide isomerase/thioredoxin
MNKFHDMKKILSIIGFVLFVNGSWSQSAQSITTDVSLVNQLCPDFVFDTLLNYKKEKVTLSEFKGKFVIIDFWGTFCIPCINAIPKMEQLQRKFGDSLQVLMVATDGFQKAKQFYETRQKANKPMLLPCAINRKFVKYFQIKEVSTYVWIDDQGTIKAITDESQITEQRVADFIRGKSIEVRQKIKTVFRDYKNSLVTTANEMDSGSVLYNSSFTKYLNGFIPTYSPLTRGRTKVSVTNLSIALLYRIAFGDTAHSIEFNRTVIESAHPEKLSCPKNEAYETWKFDNTFCYELTVPKEKQKDILKIMQGELKRMFGYNAFEEYRTQKCLVLTAEKDFHFWANKTASPKLVFNTGGITVTNHPFAQFTEMIRHYMQDKIILDETGITGNVDIFLQAEMNDVNSVMEALKKYGLHLRWENRQVQVLVIKDPE